MTFSDKLLKLRKENNLSQEALAQQLGTTRQAISKWENNQGYPETEKLLLLSNIFEVSVDYLLKDLTEPATDSHQGYYVSREMSEGYLLAQTKTAKRIALALSILVTAAIHYFIFSTTSMHWLFPTIILVAIGLCLLVSADSLDDDRYHVLKKEVLLFDQNYLKELTKRYEHLKKRCLPMSLVCVSFMCIALGPFLAIDNHLIEASLLEPYYSLFIFFGALGVYLLIYVTTVLEAYTLLVKNEAHVNSFWFKLRHKTEQFFTLKFWR